MPRSPWAMAPSWPAGTSTLGSLAGSTGTATVTGIGSRWSASGAFTVGSAGAGTLNILDQGVVSVGTTTLPIGGTSNVNLSGNPLRFDTATGLNRINYTSGTIQLPATGFNAAPVTTLFGATPTITTGKSLNIEKLAVLFSASSVVVNGGDLCHGGIPRGPKPKAVSSEHRLGQRRHRRRGLCEPRLHHRQRAKLLFACQWVCHR